MRRTNQRTPRESCDHSALSEISRHPLGALVDPRSPGTSGDQGGMFEASWFAAVAHLTVLLIFILMHDI